MCARRMHGTPRKGSGLSAPWLAAPAASRKSGAEPPPHPLASGAASHGAGSGLRARGCEAQLRGNARAQRQLGHEGNSAKCPEPRVERRDSLRAIHGSSAQFSRQLAKSLRQGGWRRSARHVPRAEGHSSVDGSAPSRHAKASRRRRTSSPQTRTKLSGASRGLLSWRDGATPSTGARHSCNTPYGTVAMAWRVVKPAMKEGIVICHVASDSVLPATSTVAGGVGSENEAEYAGAGNFAAYARGLVR